VNPNIQQVPLFSESQIASIIQQHHPNVDFNNKNTLNFQTKEMSFKLQNMRNGHRLKRNKTDILVIYKILWYMNTFRTCKTKCSLALKSGAGLKTTRILEDLISQNLIRENLEDDKVVEYEITRYGQEIFSTLETNQIKFLSLLIN
jgi:hypothetical protein